MSAVMLKLSRVLSAKLDRIKLLVLPVIKVALSKFVVRAFYLIGW